MRDLPEKSYETQPQIQWAAIDDLLGEWMTTYTRMEKVTVELEAFLPGVRKNLQRLIRARLPKTYKRGLIRFMLEYVLRKILVWSSIHNSMFSQRRRVRHAVEPKFSRRELPLAALSRRRAFPTDGLTFCSISSLGSHDGAGSPTSPSSRPIRRIMTQRLSIKDSIIIHTTFVLPTRHRSPRPRLTHLSVDAYPYNALLYTITLEYYMVSVHKFGLLAP
ncbi:hypothetical protein BC629DRAFT_1212224 [Irpex lacteus]|nr:hypothetical protein BC629DRAFT_1212224 [Irpex lacteus]